MKYNRLLSSVNNLRRVADRKGSKEVNDGLGGFEKHDRPMSLINVIWLVLGV
jgi:hypothetical protein